MSAKIIQKERAMHLVISNKIDPSYCFRDESASMTFVNITARCPAGPLPFHFNLNEISRMGRILLISSVRPVLTTMIKDLGVSFSLSCGEYPT